MTNRLRAHFDGRFLVPDQPVDLPVNQPLELEVTPCGTTNGVGRVEDALIQERRSRLRASAGVLSGPVLSDETLRRENMYDDRL